MRWCAGILALMAVVVLQTSALPRMRRQAQLAEGDSMAPSIHDEATDEENTRDRRMLESATQAKWGAKNAILGFVFGSMSPPPPTRRPKPRPSTTTESIPVFDRNKVSLEFPGALFASSLSLLINSTKVVGSVIQNSAERYQSFLRLFKPFFRGVFEIKGLDPVTTTTAKTPKKTKPTKSSANSISNEIR